MDSLRRRPTESAAADNSTAAAEGRPAENSGAAPGPPTESVPPQENLWLSGYALILGAAALFVFLTYACFLSKVTPPTGILLLDMFRNDWYYAYLLPLSLPVMVIAVYVNWLGLKFFRHN